MLLSFYAFNFFINFITSAVIGVFVLLRDPKNSKNLTFFILALFGALWSLTHYFFAISTTQESAAFWMKGILTFIFLLPSSYLHFAYSFTEKTKNSIKIVIFSYFVSFCFFAANLFSVFFKHFSPLYGYNFWPYPELPLSLLILLYSLSIFFTSFFLVKSYTKAKGIEKLQIKYVSTGLIISFLAGSLNFLIWYRLPFFFARFLPFANLLVPVYVILIAYAITRYRLMDIRIITKQILFYSGIAFFIYFLSNLMNWINILLFGNVFSTYAYLLGSVIAPFIAVLLYNGSTFFSGFINKHIFPQLYNSQIALNNASKKLSKFTSFDKIIETAVDTINKNLQPTKTMFLLLEKNWENKNVLRVELPVDIKKKKNQEFTFCDCSFLPEYLKSHKVIIKEELGDLLREKDETKKRAANCIKSTMDELEAYLCISVFSKDKLLGLIMADQKADSGSYSKEDFVFLETLLNQIQVAIENTILYSEIAEKNKNLQELLAEKDDFIRIANHQLNTPLSIMRNAYSMVKDGSLETQKGIDYWGNGLDRLSRVIQDFWSVLQTKEEIKTEISKTDLMEIVRDVLKNKKQLVTDLARNIKVTIKKPNFELPLVLCDKNQITNVLNIILENAIFYTKEGGVTVSFELINNSRFIKVNVIDTGFGFTPEEKEKIGQKFFRSESSLLAHPDGSGLGLYICKKLVENNKGELTFDSKGKNLGSTFSFTLPTAVTARI